MIKNRLIAMMNADNNKDKPVIIKLGRFNNDTEQIETDYINISDVRIKQDEIQIIVNL